MQNRTSQLYKRVVLYTILFSLFGCASKRLETEHQDVDDRLRPYLNEYIDIMIDNGYHFNEIPHVGMKIVDKIPHGYENATGLCALDSKTFEDTIRTIYIDRESYENINPDDDEYDLGVEALMFHELAHCLQDAEHTKKRFTQIVRWKRYSSRTRAFHVKDIKYDCKHLMAARSSSRPGTVDRACYEQHRDMYIDQLTEIINKGIYY